MCRLTPVTCAGAVVCPFSTSPTICASFHAAAACDPTYPYTCQVPHMLHNMHMHHMVSPDDTYTHETSTRTHGRTAARAGRGHGERERERDSENYRCMCVVQCMPECPCVCVAALKHELCDLKDSMHRMQGRTTQQAAACMCVVRSRPIIRAAYVHAPRAALKGCCSSRGCCCVSCVLLIMPVLFMPLLCAVPLSCCVLCCMVWLWRAETAGCMVWSSHA